MLTFESTKALEGFWSDIDTDLNVTRCITTLHYLDLDKIHTHVAGCPDPSRLTPKTGPIFYMTCTVFTVDWTKIVTFTAIHTRHFTAFIEI